MTHYWYIHIPSGKKFHKPWKPHMESYCLHCEDCTINLLAKHRLLNDWNRIGKGNWVYWM